MGAQSSLHDLRCKLADDLASSAGSPMRFARTMINSSHFASKQASARLFQSKLAELLALAPLSPLPPDRRAQSNWHPRDEQSASEWPSKLRERVAKVQSKNCSQFNCCRSTSWPHVARLNSLALSAPAGRPALCNTLALHLKLRPLARFANKRQSRPCERLDQESKKQSLLAGCPIPSQLFCFVRIRTRR